MPRAIITRKPSAPPERSPYILAPGSALPAEPVYWAISYRDTEFDTYAVRVTWDARQTPYEAAMYCYGLRPDPSMTFYNLGPDWTAAKEKLKSVPLAPAA
jgi:hypothetical protein